MPVTFDTSTRTYYRDGDPLSSADVRTIMHTAVDASKERVAQAARDYKEGKTNLPEFIIQLREETKNAHIAASVLANGGKDQMTASLWAQVGNVIKGEQGFIRSLERDLANGLEISADALAARAALYPELATCTYENGVVDREKEAGVERMLWVCESDDASCDDCVGAAGEYAIDELPAFGSFTCMNNCRCTAEPVTA